MVIASTTISWLGAADLDKFVALVGCFAWCGISIICVLQTFLIFNYTVSRFAIVTQLCCITKLFREHANKSWLTLF
jgi:hypothetical protein